MRFEKIYTMPQSSLLSSSILIYKNSRYSVKLSALFASIFLSIFLSGCASENLKAPCPNYGKHCDQIPVNSCDTTTV